MKPDKFQKTGEYLCYNNAVLHREFLEMFDSKNNFHKQGFVCTALETCARKIAQTPLAIFLHPMTLFSLGNNALSLGEASTGGQAISFLTTSLIAGTILRERVTEKEIGLPYFSLAAGNTATALSILLTDPKNLTGGWYGAAASASCLIIWAFGHVWRGILQRRIERGQDGQPKKLFENPILYTGLADVVASLKGGTINHANFLLTPIFAYGVKLSLNLIKSSVDCPKNVSEYIDKHVTPSRVLGGGYLLLSAHMALAHNPAYLVAATALWFAGFTRFDKNENRTFLRDTRRVMTPCPSP